MGVVERQTQRVVVLVPVGQPVVIDPLGYTGWDARLAAHPGSSFFHGTAWAQVLQETYGHRPVYFCRFVEDRLEELLPVMEVSSALTGRRGVSLPFTDFCPWLNGPPPGGGNGSQALLDLAVEYGQAHGWRYLECRNPGACLRKAAPSLMFHSHVVDLEPGVEPLFQRLDGAFRRGIRKGERSGIRVEFEHSAGSIERFYGMHCHTRRRHGLPPQPLRFFRNIARHVLERGQGVVATAWAGQRAVAAAVFFHAGKEVIYKYGASDYRFQDLRPNNVLMWEAIKRFCSEGHTRLHLGRTSLGEEGLRRFKLGLGAQEEQIAYYRYAFRARTFVADKDRTEGWFNHLFRRLPLPALRLAGSILYPHLS